MKILLHIVDKADYYVVKSNKTGDRWYVSQDFSDCVSYYALLKRSKVEDISIYAGNGTTETIINSEENYV